SRLHLILKSGICPYTDAICHGGPIGNQCKQDDQCPGARKCCPGSCGQACLLPKNGTRFRICFMGR
uniref:WAP domain-containing protein n=1 Tax=Naja naja TaxID=35670 RepID=A0A8C6VHC8_NAJNA